MKELKKLARLLTLIRNEVAYPSDDVIRNTEIFKDIHDIIEKYDRIGTEITSSN